MIPRSPKTFSRGGRPFMPRHLATAFLLFLASAAMPIGAASTDEIDPATLTTLTVEQAREIVAKNDGKGLDLRSLTSISPAVAAELAKTQGDLRLNGLKELPPDVAEAFTPFAGHFRLEGLEEISPEAAAALGRRKRGGHLYLSRLKTLPPAVAKGLAVHRGGLYFHRVGSLSDEAAAELESYRGYGLCFGGLREISEQGLITLAHHKGNWLLLGVETLTDDAAAAVGKHKGTIKLVGLKSLSDKAAQGLALHERGHGLHIPKTTAMSAEAAATLRAAGIVVPEKPPAAQVQPLVR
ncbi:MAG: hypothetical protein ACK6CT_05640 [Planctomycetia bacterium]|jgi:hypothetical protein